MSIVIVGADHLGSITDNLRRCGVHEICHVTGRNASDRKYGEISPSVNMILVLTDFVNHNTANNYKRLAKSRGIRVIFAKRSWSSIEKRIAELNITF